MVILLAPVVICLLAALLLFFGLPLATSFIVATITGGAAMWFLIRAYKRAKHRAENQWRR